MPLLHVLTAGAHDIDPPARAHGCRCCIGSRLGVDHAFRLVLTFPRAGRRRLFALLPGCRRSEPSPCASRKIK